MSKSSRYTAAIGMLFILLGANISAQKPELVLSREKELFLLNQLDTLIINYTNYAAFISDSDTENELASRFKSLFESDSVLVFDDINPNIISGKEDSINEESKSLELYISDILRDFKSLHVEVIRSNSSSVLERLYMKNDSIYFPVSILKKTYAEFIDSTKSRSIETDARLELWIRLSDTIDCDMKITGISKISPSSVEWNYTLPSLKRKKVEVAFFVKPAYSLLYPFESKIDGYENVVLIDQNPLVQKLNIQDFGLQNNYIWGHYGLNSELEFRFLWRKDEKNKTKGISFGLGGAIYNSFFQTNSFAEFIYEKDRDNESYYRITEADNLLERWTIVTADIPIKYSSEKWKNYHKGRYFKAGVRLSYVYGYAQAQTSYSNSGYYPEYGITLQDISRYGFSSDIALDERISLNVNPYNFAFELSFGKKRKSKNGRSIFYTGINLGAYYNDVLLRSDKKELFTNSVVENQVPAISYNGILNLMENARLGYAGLVFGIRKADRNEFIMKEKGIRYSDDYTDYYKDSYMEINVSGIDKRDFSVENIIPFEVLEKNEKPIFTGYTYSVDPIKNFNNYLDSRLVLSKEERKRIRKEKAKEIEFSFVVDRSGIVRDVKILNQKESEYAIKIFSLINESSSLWQPGKQEGVAVSSRLVMTHKY